MNDVNSRYLAIARLKVMTFIRDAEIFLNKQVKTKNLTNNASPNNIKCSNISHFMPVRMKLCQSKQADLLFSASLIYNSGEWCLCRWWWRKRRMVHLMKWQKQCVNRDWSFNEEKENWCIWWLRLHKTR